MANGPGGGLSGREELVPTSPKRPSRASIWTCILHLTSSIGVLIEKQEKRQPFEHKQMKTRISQHEARRRTRCSSRQCQLGHRHLPLLAPSLFRHRTSCLPVAEPSDRILALVIDQEEAGVLGCSADDGRRDTLRSRRHSAKQVSDKAKEGHCQSCQVLTRYNPFSPSVPHVRLKQSTGP